MQGYHEAMNWFAVMCLTSVSVKGFFPVGLEDFIIL
jgi:hypothetical protein